MPTYLFAPHHRRIGRLEQDRVRWHKPSSRIRSHPQKRGAAFAGFAISVIFAPAIGPTLGGWITDNYTWHRIVLINLPVGLVTQLLVSRVVEDPPFLKRLANFRIDFIGFRFWRLASVRCR